MVCVVLETFLKNIKTSLTHFLLQRHLLDAATSLVHQTRQSTHHGDISPVALPAVRVVIGAVNTLMGSIANKRAMTLDELRELHDTIAVLKRDIRIYKLLLYHGLSTYTPPPLPAHSRHDRYDRYAAPPALETDRHIQQPHGHAVVLITD